MSLPWMLALGGAAVCTVILLVAKAVWALERFDDED